VIVGSRFHGVPGALAAVLALIVPPAIIVTCVGMLYERVAGIGVVSGILAGVAAAGAGLLASAAGRLLIVLVRSRSREPLAIATVGFVLVAVVGWSLPLALVVLAPLSIALAWRREAA
jgi:chromate transporter